MKDPLGERQDNPGNIRISKIKWAGLLAQQSGDQFCRFSSASYGLAAIVKILKVYQDAHGLHTIREWISRWAPPTENDTDSYVADVCTFAGLTPDGRVDIRDYPTAGNVLRAIVHHENGNQPYDDATIAAALNLAGIYPH